jgi:hypothetical protein
MIKNAFPDLEFSFEPRILKTQTSSNLIVKSLLNCPPQENLFECIDSFDKRIFIVRDPRDRFISGMLYRSGYHRNVELDKCVEILKRKETENDISLAEIHSVLLAGESFSENFDAQLAMKDLAGEYEKDFYLLRYEEFVDGNISGLESYLDCKLDSQVGDVEPYGRVSRTNDYGAWKKWFKESDVELFKPLFESYMDYFGYNDWLLDGGKIEPCNGSEYFMKLRKEKIDE